ncbi:hypothetical protein A8950_0566 [Dongia mobilis]|uniref:Sporulation related protein n=1 Tax=Dongia mobilis TaxID=578943 RepID=A0A4R6WV24_9PROT|nr:hypothetical protein [Dongia mobilis]TDQ84020.1 hypothetical protein A8950_0566 [Dongia mobilis]
MTTSFSATSLALVCLAAGLALAGCQKRTESGGIADLTPPDPEPPATASSASDSAVATAAESAAIPPEFAGRWFVSAVFPVLARQASIADPHLGTTLVIGAAEASDVNGQRCLAPQMQIARGTANLRLGPVSLAGLERLGIECRGRPFASYLLLPGAVLDASYQAAAAEAPFALVAERPEAQYLLERAEHVLLRAATLPAALAIESGTATVLPASTPTAPAPPPGAPQIPVPTMPAPVAEKQPVAPEADAAVRLAPAAPLALTPALPEPVPETGATPAAASPATAIAGSSLPAAGSAIHLASYKGLSAAKRGWKILLGDFDALDPLSPLYVTVDVPGKGEMVRLYATAKDSADLGRACQALQAKGAYCAVSR